MQIQSAVHTGELWDFVQQIKESYEIKAAYERMNELKLKTERGRERGKAKAKGKDWD